ncbi:glycoside hydrolase family 66 protein [Metabacillus sp. 113a]|uniref:glycoside hydrolase family 66 protein n=1 Tax=Metabacillus sp. 113a TaxID=3404706 RepID=UPI003CF382A4
MNRQTRILAVSTLILSVLGLFYLYSVYKPEPNQISKQTHYAQFEVNKARYIPGEGVSFSLRLPHEPEQKTANVRYYHLNKPIASQEVTFKKEHASWTWTPPEKDYKGYLAETVIDGTRYTIGVDVSSDWKVFPRYGFLSDFSHDALKKSDNVLTELNRYHINGLQFYDWHYKHHSPLKLEDGTPSSEWEDIAGRHVSFSTLRHQLDKAKQYGMQTMAYNLLYGAFENAGPEGVKDEWRVYKDPDHAVQDIHPLPDSWKSDVYVMNSGNPEWQEYILSKQKAIYEHLPFDGWHLDQLGPRGEVFDHSGNPAELKDQFDEFLHHAKETMPDKSLVLNGVNQYGQEQIGTAPVDFMYTEVWDEYKEFGDLKKIIDYNASISGGKSTVLAAYMNYSLSQRQQGNFNPPGILLANSVIFSSGGAHLELGEHMLSSEYFPNKNLKASDELKEQLVPYYDFLVAYQNLLRGEKVKESPLQIESGLPISKKPEKGKVWAFSKTNGNHSMVHFTNFTAADSMEWRDTEGTQPEPEAIGSFEVKVKESAPIKKVWAASPDSRKAAPVPVHFSQEDQNVTIRVPSLKYWTMLVMEYE